MAARHELTLDRVASPIGTILLVCDGERTLRALDFADYETRMRRLLRRHYGEGGYSLTAGRAPEAVTLPLAHS